MKFDCGMDDHCNIYTTSYLISFTLNMCVQYSMKKNCKRKEKKKRDIQSRTGGLIRGSVWGPGCSHLYYLFVLPTETRSPKSIPVEGTGTKGRAFSPGLAILVGIATQSCTSECTPARGPHKRAGSLSLRSATWLIGSTKCKQVMLN